MRFQRLGMRRKKQPRLSNTPSPLLRHLKVNLRSLTINAIDSTAIPTTTQDKRFSVPSPSAPTQKIPSSLPFPDRSHLDSLRSRNPKPRSGNIEIRLERYKGRSPLS